jgi:uncharacterized phiE125 gp8 family phage protein
MSYYSYDHTIHYKQKQLAVKDYILVTPAVSPALDLSKVKDHLKETSNDNDVQLLSLIKSVTDISENITGRDLINKTYKGFLDCFPASPTRNIQIKKSKLQSITSIQYLVDGVLTTLDSSKYYITESNNYSTINLVDGELWPNNVDKRKQAVVITFVAGYGDDSCDIPAGLCQAMLSNLTALFENVGDCADEGANKQTKQLYTAYILPDKFFCVI